MLSRALCHGAVDVSEIPLQCEGHPGAETVRLDLTTCHVPLPPKAQAVNTSLAASGQSTGLYGHCCGLSMAHGVFDTGSTAGQSVFCSLGSCPGHGMDIATCHVPLSHVAQAVKTFSVASGHSTGSYGHWCIDPMATDAPGSGRSIGQLLSTGSACFSAASAPASSSPGSSATPRR